MLIKMYEACNQQLVEKDVANKWGIFPQGRDFFHTTHVLSYVFSILVSNANAERSFSHTNARWTKARNRAPMDLIKSEL